jgi:dolichol-phosphate mannosyltransferase
MRVEPHVLLPVSSGPLTVAPRADVPGERVRLSVIVPTCNEAKNIEEMITRLTRLLDSSAQGRYEIIVVDDSSPDGTWEAAHKLTAVFPPLQVMRRDEERGLATAVVRGWQAARGEMLAVIDADLQHPPELILALCAEMERGADLVVASRHIQGGGVSDWRVVRRVVSRGAQLIGLLILPDVLGRVTDPLSGYFIVRRSAIQGVALTPLGYKILIEILARGRCRRIGEVPYIFRERVGGKSKVTSKVYLDYLRHLLRLRFARPPLNRFRGFAAVALSAVVVGLGLSRLLRR